jgi:hypothetical protein
MDDVWRLNLGMLQTERAPLKLHVQLDFVTPPGTLGKLTRHTWLAHTGIEVESHRGRLPKEPKLGSFTNGTDLEWKSKTTFLTAPQPGLRLRL